MAITINGNGTVTGISAGGLPSAATDLSNDTSPQLGGSLDMNNLNITCGDSSAGGNNRIVMGSGADFQLWHDGSHSYIADEGTGSLKVLSDLFRVNNAANDEAMIKAEQNAGVTLSYDGSTKFETLSYGAEVTGYLHAYKNQGDSYYGSNSSHHIIQSDNDSSAALIIEHSGDTAPYGIYMRFTDCTPDNNVRYFMECADGGGTDRFRIWSDGDVENHDNSYGGISDVKLKENIVDAKSQWDDIKAIKVRNFNFKSDKPSDKRLGVIAQEIETVCPSLIDEHPDTDENNKDLGTTTKSVKYSILYMKAIKALQEAMVKIETLETKVAALEAG